MELTHEFSLSAPVGEAWRVLTDIEEIAPCVPGFTLEESDGDRFRGKLKVKVGAVQTNYACTITWLERDEEHWRVRLSAQGSETRGQGGLTATMESTLTPRGERTDVAVVTILDVTGRVAQFGRNLLKDVSDRLLGQFVAQLEERSGGHTESENSDEVRKTNAQSGGLLSASASVGSDDSDVVDLLAVAGAPVMKRLVGPALLAAALLAAFVLGRARRR